jgi:hypothetical protein
MAYPIDIESETLQLDGEWFTRDELARHIKRLLDANDFSIGRPAAALEHLNQTIASLRTVALRVVPEMQERLIHEAARQSRPVGALVRDAIAAYLGIAPAEAPAARSFQPLPPAGRRPTDPEISIPGLADTQLMEMPLIDDVHGTAGMQAPVNGGNGRNGVDYARLDEASEQAGHETER